MTWVKHALHLDTLCTQHKQHPFRKVKNCGCGPKVQPAASAAKSPTVGNGLFASCYSEASTFASDRLRRTPAEPRTAQSRRPSCFRNAAAAARIANIPRAGTILKGSNSHFADKADLAISLACGRDRLYASTREKSKNCIGA